MRLPIILVVAFASGCLGATAEDTTDLAETDVSLVTNVIADDVFADYLAPDTTSITAISREGVYRVNKNGSSDRGEFLFGPAPGPALTSTDDKVFWTTGGTELTRLVANDVSTFAQVGISASIGPVSASSGSVYWVERKYSEVEYLRSSATTNQREVLQKLTIDQEFVSAIAGIGDCVFALVSGTGVDRIDRVCSTELTPNVYVAAGKLASLAVDESGIYFVEEGLGLRRLAPIDANTPEAMTVVGGSVTRAVPSGEFVYFVRGGRGTDSTCGADSSINRVAKVSGTIDRVVAGPLACPTDLVLDENFLYWSDGAGAGAVHRGDLQTR